MWTRALQVFIICCSAASVVTAESSVAGRRLKVRRSSAAATRSSNGQWPWIPTAQLASLPEHRAPVVHFLFLAVGKVHNVDVWKSFFARAPRDQYRAYIHCKTPECLASITGTPLVPVPMVESFYCADLVTPMNQLLSEALRLGGPGANPADKFVFVSDSTLPAKPFSHIYDTLTERTGSDFCVCSVKEWATRRGPPVPGAQDGKPLEMAIKHHQWSVLERSHAESVTQVWHAGPQMVNEFLLKFQMNLPPRQRAVKTFAGSSDTGCLDEFYHMAAIYGTLPYTDSPNGTEVKLPALTNSPLRVGATADIQGACDTFVAWPEYAQGGAQPLNKTNSNSFKRFYASLDPLSVPYSGDASKPGYWDSISTHGMKAIRSSEFLFVRKFADHPKVADGGGFAQLFPEIVFN